MISGLYSGTESVVRCDGTISDYFRLNTGACQVCVLAPTLFYTCKDYVLGGMPEKRGVIFANTTDVLARALNSLSEETKPLELRVSWIKVQAFGDIMDKTIESIPGSGDMAEATQFNKR